MVGHQVLALVIGVRVPASEQENNFIDMVVSKRIKQVYASFFIAAVISFIHGLLNFILGKQELISLALLMFFVIIFAFALIYSLMEFSITKEPSDLWKVGFLGLFGLVGLIPGLGFGFFGFFGLFGFFGTRQYF